ncbi:MAG: SNF2-related protein [Candidatus Poseidoniales archaeon]|nr:SNF2-related protein [Candidatus Poseidoniales archaeon]
MLSDHDEQIGEAAYADRKVHWALLRTDLDIRFPPSDSCPLLRFGRWDDQPHQHLPASRLAASHWKGMLIADEVGLGKTISALHVLRRLHVLGERGGVLIVVPGGLRSKWMQELYHRTDLQGFEADTGAKLRQALQTIEEGEPLVVVTSHGILRQSSLVSELLENGMPEMMLSIVDEAHHVRNPNSRLHDAVQMLTLNSRNMLFLTATPINLRNEDLWVPLSLLAPDRWPDFRAFERTMRPMRQLNTALDALSKQEPDLEEARAALQILALTPGLQATPG